MGKTITIGEADFLTLQKLLSETDEIMNKEDWDYRDNDNMISLLQDFQLILSSYIPSGGAEVG